MKLAGGPQIEEMNLDQFVAQAEEYDAAGTILDSVHKLLNLVGQTHPFPVLRLNELKNWSANGSYQAILSGNYEKRGEKSDTTSNGTGADSTERRGPDIFGSFGADFESAQKEYREELKRSKDPLAQALAGLGERLDQAAETAKKTFEDFFKGPKS